MDILTLFSYRVKNYQKYFNAGQNNNLVFLNFLPRNHVCVGKAKSLPTANNWPTSFVFQHNSRLSCRRYAMSNEGHPCNHLTSLLFYLQITFVLKIQCDLFLYKPFQHEINIIACIII